MALPGLNTMDERWRTKGPLAGLISASGPLVRAWVFYPFSMADQCS